MFNSFAYLAAAVFALFDGVAGTGVVYIFWSMDVYYFCRINLLLSKAFKEQLAESINTGGTGITVTTHQGTQNKFNKSADAIELNRAVKNTDVLDKSESLVIQHTLKP